MSKRADE